jgi:hypothetical protein
LAGQNVVEELIDLLEEAAVWRLLPGGAPEDSKNLDGSEKWAVAIREMRRNCGSRAGRCLGTMQWNHTDRMLGRNVRFRPARLFRHVD